MRTGWKVWGVAVGLSIWMAAVVSCGGGGTADSVGPEADRSDEEVAATQETPSEAESPAAGANEPDSGDGSLASEPETVPTETSGEPSGSGGQPSQGEAVVAVTDYAEEARRIARLLWDPETDEEGVQAALLDAFRAVGLGVYDTDDNAILVGSGSPSDGGVYLMDYEVTLLARAFIRFREDWGAQRIPLEAMLRWEELGISLYDQTCGSMEFTLPNIKQILQMEYATRQLTGESSREYFLGNLVTELDLQNPHKETISVGKLPGFDELDPLQAFLIALDWLTEPLASGIQSATSLCDLPGFPVQSGQTNRKAPEAPPGATGFWGWVKKAERVKGDVEDALNLIKAEMLVYGTKLHVTGPEDTIHYVHPDASSSGPYEFTATVEFIDDYGPLLAGRVLPEKGPFADALVRFETTNLERHGTIEEGAKGNWALQLPLSLAWDARTDRDGQASFLFQPREENPVEVFEVIEPVHIWAYANPVPTSYWPGQVAMLLFPIQEIAFFEVGWHEAVHGL